MIALLVVVAARDASADPRSDANELLRQWAPVYVQHVASDDNGADRPTRVDFDGDWNTRDNWDRQELFGTALPPAAYGAAVLTDKRAYLTYTLYYPRDWHRHVCVAFVCHDNDLETIQLVVDLHDRRLASVRAKTHLHTSETNGDTVARTADGHPLLWVEAEGHGISICRPNDPDCVAGNGRIVYAPGAAPSEPPIVAIGQTVTYKLLSLYDTLWVRRHIANRGLWTDGETGPLFYNGRRYGRIGFPMGASVAGTRYVGGVRPPWAVKGPIGTRGDWFIDPAGSDRSPTLNYMYNPFLDDLVSECIGERCERGPGRERSRTEYFVRLGAPYLLASVGAILVNGWLRRRGARPPF